MGQSLALSDDERRLWFRREILPLEPRLRAYAVRFCRGGTQEAEDLVHDTFAKLIAYEGWRGVEDVAAFAARTLKNIALNSLRRRKVVAISSVADPDDLGFSDELPDPEAVAVGRDELRVLGDLIAELPPQCRRVFTLCKIYGISHAEIAVRLGLSVSTVEKHVAHGLRYCSERLARESGRGARTSTGQGWSGTRQRHGKR